MLEITFEQFLPLFTHRFRTKILLVSIGALYLFSKSKNHTFLSIGLGFSAGVMVYVSFMEILAKSKTAFSAIYENPLLGESLALVCFLVSWA